MSFVGHAELRSAEFVVSPSLHRDVIDVCNRYGAPVVPGVATPTEAGAVAVGAGGSIVDADAVARGDYDAVTERARALVDAVEAAR